MIIIHPLLNHHRHQFKSPSYSCSNRSTTKMNALYLSLSALLLLSVCHGQLNHEDYGHNNQTTTTRKPDTTTTKHPTTTSKPTTTTTTTTRAPPPTTTPKPTPKPSSFPVVSGNITSEKNYTCLRYNFTLLMNLAHTTKDNKTEFVKIYLPEDAKVDSDHCSSDQTESFWFEFDKNSVLKLTFTKSQTSVYLASITGKIYLNDTSPFPLNITNPDPNFNVDKSHSYVCANNITIKDNCHQSELLFSNLKLQAFIPESQKGEFSDEHNCQNEISDVVPIAVGAALTALVIIVMIAYFIGRRRSRRMAYQSV